jgi:hypothetical protein
LGFFPWLIKLFGVTPYILEGYSAIAWIPEPNIIVVLGTALIFCNTSVVSLLVFGYSIRSIFQLDGLKKHFYKASFSGSLKRIKAYFLDTSKFNVNFCFLWMGIPIILALSISLILQPIYLPKYLILVSPAFYLLISQGLAKMKPKIRYILVLILLIDSVLISYSYYTNFNKEQWREATIYVQAREGPGDLIIITAPWLEQNFRHYYNGNNIVIGVQTIDQVDEALTIEHNNVWLVLSHDVVADPAGLVKSRLDDVYQLNSEKEFVSQDILNNISIFGYPITDNSIEIKLYYYSK